MADYIQESERLKQNILTYCKNAQNRVSDIDSQYDKIKLELDKMLEELKWVYKVAYESEQTAIARQIYDCIKRVDLSLSILIKYNVAQLSETYTPFIQLTSDSACVITRKDSLKESSVYEEMNMIDDEASLAEGSDKL